MKRFHSESGFSLVELMVAIVVGMAMVVALSYVFVSANQAGRVHGGVSRMQEDGRYAINLMGRAIQQAGASSNSALFTGIALAAPSLPAEGAGRDIGTDTITLQYAAQDGGEADCIGQAVAAGGAVVYHFFVNGGVLSCSNDVPNQTSQPIVEGVEDLQILYGVWDNKSGTGYLDKADRYLPANVVIGEAKMDDVVAVRVSLVLRSSSGLSTGQQKYHPDKDPATDYRLRQVYSATFVLRNRMQQ